MTVEKALYNYIIRLGDNALILGQRLAEWCGHAHQLETDIALTNIALDQIGQARILLSEAAAMQGEGKTEDTLAFHRDEKDFRNNLLVEIENGDFGLTMMRQFLFDTYQYYLLKALTQSKNEFLKAYAEKSIKEVTYHLRLSSDWVIRLGDGTEVSHEKMKSALERLWKYTGELFEMNETDKVLIKEGFAPDLNDVKSKWAAKVEEVLTEATLPMPDMNAYMATGARSSGYHTEYMGYILAEMQHIPRSMPEAQW